MSKDPVANMARDQVQIFLSADATAIDHAKGIRTIPLVVPRAGAELPCGISIYAAGVEAPMHRHNCSEQILVLEGHAEVRSGDRRQYLGQNDCVWIPAGMDHGYSNVGEGELRLLWVYDASEVTRIATADGTSVPLLAVTSSENRTAYPLSGGQAPTSRVVSGTSQK